MHPSSEEEPRPSQDRTLLAHALRLRDIVWLRPDGGEMGERECSAIVEASSQLHD